MKDFSSTACRRSASFNQFMLLGSMDSPMTKRGKVCFSTTSSLKPSLCRRAAALEPAGPAPMINTSVSIVFISLVEAKSFLRGFGAQQGGYLLNILGQGAVIIRAENF